MKAKFFRRLRSLATALFLLPGAVASADEFDPAAGSINRFGLELERQLAARAGAGNIVISPYSIQATLAMAHAGAEGATRDEMAKVLHFPDDDAALAKSFAALRQALGAAVKASPADAQAAAGKKGFFAGLKGFFSAGEEPAHVLQIRVANRLFAQADFAFRKPFLSLLEGSYGAPLESLDFAGAVEKSRARINVWVEEQTRKKIRDLIPAGGVTGDTCLVLVNALYFNSPWAEKFLPEATRPRPFHIAGGDAADVPAMVKQAHFGYAKRDGFTAVSLPYEGGALSFLILLPDAIDGLDALAAKVTPALLRECAALPAGEIILFLPKFRAAGVTIPLGKSLQALGMKTAFDVPAGSANFDRMADKHLAISEVFHQTFIALDEDGTEAAAATAAVIALPAPPHPEVRVDRPFLFAIQHRASGACLFLGRITDPR